MKCELRAQTAGVTERALRAWLWRKAGHNGAMWTVPNLLSGVRFLMVPVLLWLAFVGFSRVFLVCLLFSLATDAADGLVARRFHQATRLGARLDSWADFLTYMALTLCAWWLRPEVLRQEALMIGAGISSYLLAIAIGFLKFGRLTSYHTWGAKLIALLFAAALIVLFSGGPGWVFRILVPLVILVELEEIGITLVLSEPLQDVPSLWHAMKKKGAGQLCPESSSATPKNRPDVSKNL